MKNTKANILVVEDDPALLNGLLDYLVFNSFEVKGEADGAEGLKTGLAENFDLMILDVMLPNMDGFEICRQIRAAKPGQAIIMLTAKGSEDDIVTGFKAGADDYICKPFSLRELMVRVQAVLRRAGKALGDEKVEIRGMVFDAGVLKASYGEETIELTRREMDIIIFLNRNRDRIISKKDLLEKVWQYADTDVETRTVDIHMLKLKKKITALAPDMPLIQTVRGEGYRLSLE